MFFDEFLCLRKKTSAIKNCIIIAKKAILRLFLLGSKNYLVNLSHPGHPATMTHASIPKEEREKSVRVIGGKGTNNAFKTFS